MWLTGELQEYPWGYRALLGQRKDFPFYLQLNGSPPEVSEKRGSSWYIQPRAVESLCHTHLFPGNRI